MLNQEGYRCVGVCMRIYMYTHVSCSTNWEQAEGAGFHCPIGMGSLAQKRSDETIDNS